MSIIESFKIAGVDGYKAGWFVVKARSNLTAKDHILELKESLVVNNFDQVLSATTDCKLVCVDIPIGLSDNKPRQCDTAARKLLSGKRAGSVFPAPVRGCLWAEDYQTASKISFECCGKKLTRQSFGLLKKIRQVDDLMTPVLQNRVREIHPEVSFCILNDKEPMRHNKKKLPGRKERVKLLSEFFTNPEQIVDEARRRRGAEPDDVLDAVVAACTASRVVIGKARTLPASPELDGKGLRMEILCPGK